MTFFIITMRIVRFDLGGGINKYFIFMTVIIFIILTQHHPAINYMRNQSATNWCKPFSIAIGQPKVSVFLILKYELSVSRAHVPAKTKTIIYPRLANANWCIR